MKPEALLARVNALKFLVNLQDAPPSQEELEQRGAELKKTLEVIISEAERLTLLVVACYACCMASAAMIFCARKLETPLDKTAVVAGIATLAAGIAAGAWCRMNEDLVRGLGPLVHAHLEDLDQINPADCQGVVDCCRGDQACADYQNRVVDQERLLVQAERRAMLSRFHSLVTDRAAAELRAAQEKACETLRDKIACGPSL